MKETINAQFIAFKTRCVAFFNEELKPLGYTDYSCDDLTQFFVGNATPFFNFAVSRICPRTGRNIWALFMDYCPTDKNGKEIYEGDILSVRRYDNEFMSESEEFRDAFNIDELKGNEIETITDCVFYEEASFYVGNLYLVSLFGNQKHSNPIHEFEVIGNIHDNPELLNEK